MTLNIAVVGLGIGAEHIAALCQLPDNYKLHTLCDLNEELGESLCKENSGTHFTRDIEEVFSSSEIDIVDICLPPHLHLGAILKALESGKHVVCEKPLVTSLSELDQLERTVKRTGRQVFPVFQYRFGPAAEQLLALIDAGVAGNALVASLETHWDRDKNYYDVPWRGTWAGEQGGAILTHAIHSHDWLTWIFGPVKSVYANLATRVNSIEVEDCAVLNFEMQSGALASSSITLGAAGDSSRLRFCFSELTAESGTAPYAPAGDKWTFTSRCNDKQSEVDRITQSALTQNSQANVGYAGFFRAISRELDAVGSAGSADIPVVTLQDARQSIELATAIYASSRSNTRVVFPLGADHPLYNGWVPDS